MSFPQVWIFNDLKCYTNKIKENNWASHYTGLHMSDYGKSKHLSIYKNLSKKSNRTVWSHFYCDEGCKMKYLSSSRWNQLNLIAVILEKLIWAPIMDKIITVQIRNLIICGPYAILVRIRGSVQVMLLSTRGLAKEKRSIAL